MGGATNPHSDVSLRAQQIRIPMCRTQPEREENATIGLDCCRESRAPVYATRNSTVSVFCTKRKKIEKKKEDRVPTVTHTNHHTTRTTVHPSLRITRRHVYPYVLLLRLTPTYQLRGGR